MGRCLPFIYSRHRRLMFQRVVCNYASIITYYSTDGFQTSEPLPDTLIDKDIWKLGALREVTFEKKEKGNRALSSKT